MFARTTLRRSCRRSICLHAGVTSSTLLRLAYTYPASDPFLPLSTAGTTIYSRLVKITVRR